MNMNSQNPKTGKDFELAVIAWFEKQYDKRFEKK